MPKRRRPGGLRPDWRPDRARPLDPEGFRDAMIAALTASTTPHPLLHERVSPHIVFEEEGEALQFTDTPVNRAILTLRDRYPEELDYRSACWRFWALGPLLDQPELAPWVEVHAKNRRGIAEAVFFVAATAPMNATGEFYLKAFVAAVVRWEAEHPDASEP